MPPKCKFTREEIINAALDITREEGINGVTARAVGAKLNSSPKVIFNLFKNMDELQDEVMKSANELYNSFLETDMKNGKNPPYKSSGMAYIRFAKEEKELFKLLFMRDRSSEKITENKEEIRPLLEIIQKNIGLCEQEAYMFHLEMWVFVHGIATMVATDYLDWDWEFISKMMTDEYEGIKSRFLSKGEYK